MSAIRTDWLLIRGLVLDKSEPVAEKLRGPPTRQPDDSMIT